jgi:hypothetical protein
MAWSMRVTCACRSSCPLWARYWWKSNSWCRRVSIPYRPFAVSPPALIRLNFCLACQRESEPMSTSRTAPRITICGIPELGEYSAAGVTHILSILGPNLPDPPEFAAFAPHRRLILALSPRRPFTIG